MGWRRWVFCTARCACGATSAGGRKIPTASHRSGQPVPALAGNVRAAPQDPRVLLQYHPAYRFVAGPEHPQIREPKDWTISICADFIAALARLNVDELSRASSPRRPVSSRGDQPMKSNSRASFLYALRRFSSTMNSGAGDGCNSAPIAIWPRPTPRPSAVASIPG